MCLILIAKDVIPQYPLVIAANRDEFYSRQTAQLSAWSDHPGLYGGRDLAGRGTWMGVTRTGRFAAVTNYRDPRNLRPNAPTRGILVSKFLTGQETPTEYASGLQEAAGLYNGFNLLLGHGKNLIWYSNRGGEPVVIDPGIYGLSNALFDTPWPKVQKGKELLARVIGDQSALCAETILGFLKDTERFPDDSLPDTGVGLEWERILCSMFIKSPHYGTRSSSVLLFDKDGAITFAEQTFENGKKTNAPIRIEIPPV